jgi:hypothetical protein
MRSPYRFSIVFFQNSSLKNISYKLSAFVSVAGLVLFSHCGDDGSNLQITEVVPEVGCRGGSLVIIGNGFSYKKTDNIVKLDGNQLEVLLAYSDKLWVQIPKSATAGQITVQVGNDVVKGPVYSIAEPQYFIRFKANGKLKIFETCDPESEVAWSCAVGNIPSATEGSYAQAEISICLNEMTTTSSMEGWANDKLGFEGNLPRARFEYYDDDERDQYGTNYADSETDSELNITEVTIQPDDQERSYITYQVKGTFHCNVNYFGNEDDIAITDGEFSILLSANKP